jgi:hypothetical protein
VLDRQGPAIGQVNVEGLKWLSVIHCP